MSRRHVVVMVAVLTLLPGLASAGCERQLLQALGWRFEPAAVAAPQVVGGEVCRRADLADAHAAGDLRVLVPSMLADADEKALVQELLQHPATRCAYMFELGQATRRAAQALEGNDGYRFSALQLGWIGFGVGGAQRKGWQRFRSFGRGYQPAGSNSQALEAFYSGRVRSECGVGRQVAQLATQRELYGDAAFDEEFAPGELSIGTFLTLHRTDSILLGSSAGEFFADGKARRTARMGRQAFIGVPGFIEHVFDRSHLDDIHNQAENFVVTEVSEAAAQALERHGGFEHYDRLNHRIWELSRRLAGPGSRRFERLLVEREPWARKGLSPEQREVLAEVEILLDDPVYRGFLVYVHPLGIRPLGYHIVRLLDRNPRTPYSFNLALHNLHTTLYQRWLQRRLRDCPATGQVAAEHILSKAGGRTWNWQ